MSTPTATAEELRASLRASRARVLELEDALRLREELSLVTEKQLEGAWVTLAERDALIASMTGESGRDGGGWAVRRNEVLDRVFEALREAFTCPICFDGFTKSAAVSLQCGHTFCSPCLKAWTTSNRHHQVPTMDGSYAAKYERPQECPECRLGVAHPSARRVRLYALEEAIRLVGRAERDRLQVDTEEKEWRERVEAERASPPHPSSPDARQHTQSPPPSRSQ